jgi:hypothetical protein
VGPTLALLPEGHILPSLLTYQLVTLRRPFILTNTVTQSWKAAELWTPEYLQQHPSLMVQVFRFK